jgi:ribosomal protein S18 acetylase RimI-like enzyme
MADADRRSPDSDANRPGGHTERLAGFTIRRAEISDVERIAPLFDAYRVFYGQAPDAPAAAAFLRARLEREESVVFVAETDQALATPLGFTQLYPGFSSVSVAPIIVLNDLFVDPAARARGVARALLRRAEEHARETGAVRLALTTARDNLKAQRVYEAMGWQRDEVFFTYTRSIG